MLDRDAADSPRACIDPDFAEIEARELLSNAVHTYGGPLPVARQVFERFVLEVCAQSVAVAIEDAGEGSQDAHQAIAAIIGEVRKMANPWLAMRCLPIVFSLPCGEGESETDIAGDFGLTKGAVSAVCIDLRKRLRVPPGRGMKKDTAREAYRLRQIGKRARPLPSRWPFAGLLRELRTAA